MQTRTPRALAAVATLALALGACTDVPTAAPPARTPGARASLATGSTLISNTVKYRDNGGKPARGRSGSAELTATALLAKNGVTTLNLVARHVTQAWQYGEITRAQVQASNPEGKHKFTRNVDDSHPGFDEPHQLNARVRLPGLASGDRLRLQAHVEELDPNRVDVVTVEETVKRIPDLRVRVSAPAQVESNTWVNILAVVSEHNGDVGTRAVCELFVAGELVDFAEDVWVDAGDAVTCAMTWQFPVPGTYPVEVRVRTLMYDEWEPADNVDTATVQVSGDAPGFSTIAWFTHRSSTDSSASQSQWRDAIWGQTGESSQESYWSQTNQSAYATGHLPVHLTGPVSVQASMSTGGRVLHEAEWALLGADTPWGWCQSAWGGRTIFSVCTGGGPVQGSTSFSYSFTAGAVTYHSRGYSKVWDDWTGTEWVYHRNDGYGWDDTVPVGDDWTFTVRLQTESGEYDGSRTLQLVRERQEQVFPWRCSTEEYPEWGYSSTSCSARTVRSELITGG